MAFFALSVLLQVVLVVHIFKTGRPYLWIYVVVFLPMAGSIAYIIVELLPDLAGTRTGRRAQRKVAQLINPDKELKQAAFNYSQTATTENAMRLAQALLVKGEYSEAVELFECCLRGLHESDPHLMFGLAQALFGAGRVADARCTLDDLIIKNPDYKNPDAHLLYARILERLGELVAARHEYEVLESYFSGPEACYYYARFLMLQGESAKAGALVEKILTRARHAGSHYRDIHAAWIKAARELAPR